uniref:L-serine deaminase n=1 Tax=Neogobius melanostomus TaxID=47308 RepID=A0A8C6WXT6_9GOBI
MFPSCTVCIDFTHSMCIINRIYNVPYPFVPLSHRDEVRLGLSATVCQLGPVCNGTARRRPTLIEPHRLRDFGEDEQQMNGDVRVFETTVQEAPEFPLQVPPKTRRRSQFVPRPPVPYLRFEDISAAAFRIHGNIQKTPCTYSRLSKQYGMEIYLKKEHLMYTGSVKERGALYLLTSLSQEEQRKGVITATDCNFSLAVAHHAVELKIPVFVIMPSSCCSPRLRVYRDYGAMVISYGSTAQDAQKHARQLASDNGYLYLEEDESETYLAGLGTVGLEIYEQVSKVDAVLVPAAGHYGLLAGTAAAVKHLNANIQVIGIEPEGFPLLRQSIKTDSPMKDFQSNPNRKLYGGNIGLLYFEFERTTVDTEAAMGLAAIIAGHLSELRGKR